MAKPVSDKDRLIAFRACASIAELLEFLVPGKSEVTKRLRAEIAEVSRNLTARGIFLAGAPGTGKSTVARAIALARWLSWVLPDAFASQLKGLSLEADGRVSPRTMNWYREKQLCNETVDQLAVTLFGVAARTFNNADRKHGLFRLAAHGMPPDKHERPSIPAIVTRGVVFLDEIADLPPTLQPHLLAALSGGLISPLGSTDPNEAFVFDGLVIGASWQDPSVTLRADLLDRLSDYTLKIPSLTERLDDLPLIVDSIVASLKHDHHRRLIQLRGEDAASDSSTNKLPQDASGIVDLASLTKHCQNYVIGDDDIDQLAGVDWSRCGELRGLRQTINRAMTSGRPMAQVIADHQRNAYQRAHASSPLRKEHLLNDVFTTPKQLLEAAMAESPCQPDTLKQRLLAVWRRYLTAVREHLTQNPIAAQAIAERMNCSVTDLRLSELDRNRT
jgi:transcriptional regulator with PAS, ATPase and Fis domain